MALPRLDFSPIGDLANTYRQAKEYKIQNERRDQISNARRAFGNNPDMALEDLARQLFAAGDVQGAQFALGQAGQQSNRDWRDQQAKVTTDRYNAQQKFQQENLLYNRGQAEAEKKRQASRIEQAAKFAVAKGWAETLDEGYALADNGLLDDAFKANQGTKAVSAVGKIQTDLKNNLISPEIAKAAIEKVTSGQNFSVTTADGTTVQYGAVGNGAGIQKTTFNKIDEKQLNAAEMGARLADIKASFRPEFQTFGTRFSNAWKSGKAFINPDMLSPGDKKSLTEFSTFKSGALNNINRVLNELSGAAVSPQEATRIRGSLPDPGEGIFDGDDPITFQAKMDRVLEETNKALIRYEFYKSQGSLPGSLDKIPLSNIKKINGNWQIKTTDGIYAVKD